MYPKDRLRIIFALLILLLILLSYWISGSKDIAGYFAVGGLLLWLGLMFYLRKSED